MSTSVNYRQRKRADIKHHATLHHRVVVYFRELQIKEAETVAERDAHHAAQADLRQRVLQHFQEFQFRVDVLAACREVNLAMATA